VNEYIAPSVKVIHNAIRNPQALIDLAKTRPDLWKKSRVGGESIYDDKMRVSNELRVGYGLTDPIEFYMVNAAIYSEAHKYADENGFRFSHMESTLMLEYLDTEGFFDRHSDAGPDFPRSMSAILYLNDVEEGGETWFDKFSLMVKAEAGKLVLFPANYAYTHQALPPISNNKYVLVSWFGMELNPEVFGRYYK
jgi:hypothetical protein